MKGTVTRFLVVHARRVALMAVTLYGPMLLIHGYCITGRGGWNIAGVEMFLVVPVIAFIAMLLCAPLMLSADKRQFFLPTFVMSASILLLFLPAMIACLDLRSYGFFLATQRAKPLIAAIEKHVQEKGSPPAKLADLVPEYLPSMPAGLPQLEIVDGATARDQFYGNEWALDSVVASGLINWDRFIYLPNQNYPQSGYGGWIERIERWAYVHE